MDKSLGRLLQEESRETSVLRGSPRKWEKELIPPQRPEGKKMSFVVQRATKARWQKKRSGQNNARNCASGGTIPNEGVEDSATEQMSGSERGEGLHVAAGGRAGRVGHEWGEGLAAPGNARNLRSCRLGP